MISILVPTRGRPDNMERLVTSAFGMASLSVDVEFVFYIDSDDQASIAKADELDAQLIVGERIVLSQMWNECAAVASHDIMMHCGDDIIFRTADWDQMVVQEFDNCPDKILLVYGRDGIQDVNLATHGFLHRRWVDALGYFVPPYFSSDYNDTWNTEVARRVGRLRYLPNLYTEHMHPTARKGPLDQTHQDRLARHSADNVDQLYRDLAHKRIEDAEKLKAVIDGYEPHLG